MKTKVYNEEVEKYNNKIELGRKATVHWIIWVVGCMCLILGLHYDPPGFNFFHISIVGQVIGWATMFFYSKHGIELLVQSSKESNSS